MKTMQAWLAWLAQRGVTRLLVEGGPHVWRSFLDADLVDELVLFEGQGELGGRGLAPFAGSGLELLAASGLKMVDSRALGGDKMSIWRNLSLLKES
jgi:diaminohydroxyphosphoribosylaminopyrimidine deaminase/5-amino-6-(5-phosphoribosylamino)uracil reductase